jgi:hypothetical protein
MRTRRRPSRFERAHREAMDVVKFIDAHGEKLATFCRYRVGVPRPIPNCG